MPKTTQLKCFFGCVIDGPLHRFPKWEYPHTEKFEQWKSVLDSATQERGNSYIYNSIRICHRHFEDYFKSPSRRLTGNAIPTLNLTLPRSEQVMQPQQLKEVVPITSDTLQLEAESTTLPSALPQTQQIVQPSTAQFPVEEPSTSSFLQFEVDTESRALSNAPKKRCSKQDSSSSAVNRLTLKLNKLRQKCRTQSKQIKAAMKCAMSKPFLASIEKLPATAQTFMKLQLKWKKTPRGRRYTIEEKIMALSILKQSPKAYKLLEKMFVLPSKRSLQKLLSAFTIRPGINKDILENLKKLVLRMPEEKKLVNLLFDEVSLAPGLIYNAFSNEIIGFEDDGTQKTGNIADHALVFMIKGIKSKTKQPICFTFVKSGTKKEKIKALLLLLIKEINNTGLTVVATVCDQCPANVAAIKDIKEETQKRYANKGWFFEVNGKKVFPLFDTPHLLKGVRNNLLTKNAKFIQNGQEKWAKWEHLKMFLDIDVGDDEIRLVNKLTENHIIKDKIKKMKVKLAAQVFSQRVSSAIRFSASKCKFYYILPQSVLFLHA
ncbi:hypothetical protein PYW07_010936 [Mythimna separata]|uniref:THAP-type domain-containing protein n=1 Tax=Mythimna separata TaxID=271217 RepID=A0AAD8DLF1_MYTSE|nr:hypothetical protein PYW07_010936 [Mythimna separata]